MELVKTCHRPFWTSLLKILISAHFPSVYPQYIGVTASMTAFEGRNFITVRGLCVFPSIRKNPTTLISVLISLTKFIDDDFLVVL